MNGTSKAVHYMVEEQYIHILYFHAVLFAPQVSQGTFAPCQITRWIVSLRFVKMLNESFIQLIGPSPNVPTVIHFISFHFIYTNEEKNCICVRKNLLVERIREQLKLIGFPLQLTTWKQRGWIFCARRSSLPLENLWVEHRHIASWEQYKRDGPYSCLVCLEHLLDKSLFYGPKWEVTRKRGAADEGW